MYIEHGVNFMARICPLFSGSSGNCIYVGSGNGGILVDAGVSARRIQQSLLAHDIDPAGISAIFITHEHSDHVAGLRVFAGRLGIRVYASTGTLRALEDMSIVSGQISAFDIGAGAEEAGMRVTAFNTSHDSAQSVGYRIHTPDSRTIAVATDLGEVTEHVRRNMMGADLVVLESNHDVRMLQNGQYPYFLKRRILSATGHLSNEACATELEALAYSGTTRFILGHLSRDNNHPDLAYQTAASALECVGLTEGSDYVLSVASPADTGCVTIF